MDSWGNNPATLGAAATAVAAAAIIFAWLSLRESKAQRRALEAEISSRMRPWVGLFSLEFQGGKGHGAELHFLLRNFGPLPAQQARLKIVVEPREESSDERANPIVLEESGVKALMPTENGDYVIDLSRYQQMNEWIRAGQDVVVNGTFEYALVERKFQSQFLATLWFSRSQSPDATAFAKRWKPFGRHSDLSVPVNWKNMSGI